MHTAPAGGDCGQLLRLGGLCEFDHGGDALVGHQCPVLTGDGIASKPSPNALAEKLGLTIHAFVDQNGNDMSAASFRDDLLVGSHDHSLAFLLEDVNRTPSGSFSSARHMTTPGERLRDIRQQRGLSTSELAERVGRSESAVRNQENGTNGIPATLAAKYARALSVTPEWLLYGHGEVTDPPATDSVPVVGYVSAGASLVQYADGQGPFDYVPAPRISSPSTVAATVRGVSLGPAFDEALVFYDDKRSPVTSDLHGKLCVVGLTDGRVLVKVLRPGEDGHFHLTSNTAEDPLWNQDVNWAAKVTEIRPR